MGALSTAAAEELFRLQLQEWRGLAEGYAALGEVRERRIDVGGSEFRIQYNPARICSSAATIDKETIAGRPCFLCDGNRPAMQRGIAWREYTLIVNPYPIFPVHFTIPTAIHTGQRIISRFRDMMSLALELEGYTVFYNGPECGASAPDHAHFQAGTSGIMPIEAEVENAEGEDVAHEGDGARLRAVRGLCRVAMVIESATIDAGVRLFEKLYGALDAATGKEPMINVLCRWTPTKGWTIIVFPRAKHRPSCYYAQGSDRMLISPAAVDLGGLIITPREEDFARLTASDVRQILDEVCIAGHDADNIINRIKKLIIL